MELLRAREHCWVNLPVPPDPLPGPLADRRLDRAGIALGFATTWNVTSVGAAADPLADAYGVSLPAIGLLTTALFVTHLAAQLPAGHLSDRLGARRVGLAALAATALGNGLALLADVFALGLAARLVTGSAPAAASSPASTSSAPDGGGPTTQGLYGGGTMAGGGLAIAVVPLLDGLGWRAPYWTGLVLALACFVPLLLAPNPAPSRAHAARAQRRRRPAPAAARRGPGGDVRPERRRRELGGDAARAPGRRPWPPPGWRAA